MALEPPEFLRTLVARLYPPALTHLPAPLLSSATLTRTNAERVVAGDKLGRVPDHGPARHIRGRDSLLCRRLCLSRPVRHGQVPGLVPRV